LKYASGPLTVGALLLALLGLYTANAAASPASPETNSPRATDCWSEPAHVRAVSPAKPDGYLHSRCKTSGDCEALGFGLWYAGLIADYSCTQMGDEWWLYVW
jgi:hypothetical protein